MSFTELRRAVISDTESLAREINAQAEAESEREALPPSISGHQPKYLDADGETMRDHLFKAMHLRGLSARVYKHAEIMELQPPRLEERAAKFRREAQEHEEAIGEWMRENQYAFITIGDKLIIDAQAVLASRDVLVLSLDELSKSGGIMAYNEF